MKKQKTRPAAGVAEAVKVEMGSVALRRVRAHARSSMGVEVCGVLVGREEAGRCVVEAAIEGENSSQGGSHVTFTQETWQHIYEIKDREYAESRMVGWYHSHPGFGVFLSEQDLFIQKNFFSSAGQVAWVYDPKSDEEGCFGWKGGEIVRLEGWTVRDDGGGDGAVVREEERLEERMEAVGVEESKENGGGRRWLRALSLVVTHVAVLVLGVVLGAVLLPRVVVVGVPERVLQGYEAGGRR